MRDKVLFIFFLFSVFVLALIKIENSDAWTHLSIGREIFNLRGLPESEPFTYPMLGKPFASASWLFGFVFYIAWHLFNIYGVIALKAVTVTTAFYFLTRDSLQPYKNYIIAIGVMTVVIIMTRPRFVERPDIFLMVFLSFTVFSLNAFLYENKKYIYLLPLVHMAWANMHVSISLMFIPFLAFIAGGMLQLYLDGKRAESREQRAKIKTIALVFAASFAMSLVSPYFISQYTAGYDIMASLAPLRKLFLTGQAGDQAKNMLNPGAGQGINIIELQRPRWGFIKWPYLMSLAVAASFILNWGMVYYSRSTGKAKKYPSLIHLFLVLPFIVLSFTAMRFVPLLGIIAGPVLARNLSEIFKSAGGSRQRAESREQGAEGRERWASQIFRSRAGAAILAVWLVLYSALALAHVKPFGDSRQQFGFGINYGLVPEEALRYMDKRNITGRMFNLFHWGQYITWRDFPKRRVFVDGRFGLPGDLLEKVNIAQADPSVLDELEGLYGFESVLVGYLLLNPHEAGGGRMLDSQPSSFLSSPRWALVYWDDQSLLYLKRGGMYDSVIMQDEYRFIKPADDINGGLIAKLHVDGYRDGIIRELKRNVTETGSSRGYAFLGLVYNESGLYNEALVMFSKVRITEPFNFLPMAQKGIAFAKIRLGEEYFRKGVSAYLEKNFDTAMQEFTKSIEANPGNPAAYSNLGYIYYETGKFEQAYKNHKKAVAIDRNFASSRYGLALIYKKRGNTEMAKREWAEYLRIEPTGAYAKKAREEMEALSR
ncbi:MAG: TPR Domain containing protein [Nitrospirae bacterium]|nr:MAG: TPR Domain containing protein [Nitrospirota bacterium]